MGYRKFNDEKVIASLLTHNTVRDVSKDCGISEKAIYNRLKEPDFKSKYDKARIELLEQHTHSLQKSIGIAVEQMQKIAEDKEASPQVRLNASEAIVRCSLKLTEQIDIIRRLDRIEEAINEDEGATSK